MSTEQVEGILSFTHSPLQPPLWPLEALEVAEPAVDGVELVAPSQNTPCAGSELPAELADTVWRANELGHGRTAVVATGFAALDAELPDGGWPSGSMTEILQSQPGLLEWRLAGPCLRSLVAGGRSVVLIGPPKPPHLPGLRHLGLNENCLVWIKAELPSERLWCAELMLRSNATAAVLAWLPQCLPSQLRRLQVAAAGSEGPVFVFRPADARYDASPAPLRLLASPRMDWQVKVEIIKRRGPAHETPLLLDSVPGGLQHVLTPRMLKPSSLVHKEAPREAVDCPVDVISTSAARVAEKVYARPVTSDR
jgi:protein ImuA